jgi:hypothetical protein
MTHTCYYYVDVASMPRFMTPIDLKSGQWSKGYCGGGVIYRAETHASVAYFYSAKVFRIRSPRVSIDIQSDQGRK